MVKHWGVWSDENGWDWSADGIVFFTENIAIASAQCYKANKMIPPSYRSVDNSRYRVRCIEDWYAEKNMSDTLEVLDAP